MGKLISTNPYFIFFIAIVSVASCTYKPLKNDSTKFLDTLQLSYARGFSVQYYRDYKKVIVYNPWNKNNVYAQYYLVYNKATPIPTGGVHIEIPLRNIATTSVTHIALLDVLTTTDKLCGVCSPHLIYSPSVRKMLQKGLLADLGDAFHIDIEKTLQLHPQGIMVSGYGKDDSYTQRLLQAGITVIFNNEWMETSPLARAEWIKFVGVFFDKEKQADSIFKNIEKQYNKLCEKVKFCKSKPHIMSGSNFRGIWYMPGGKSYMGKLFADAGAKYHFDNDTTSGSIPLSVEAVLQYFSGADIWLNCNFSSIDGLKEADSKHKFFRPVSTRQVYNFNKRMLPSSANDFWETAVVRPDILLADIIAILHPSLLPNRTLVYAEKLK